MTERWRTSPIKRLRESAKYDVPDSLVGLSEALQKVLNPVQEAFV